MSVFLFLLSPVLGVLIPRLSQPWEGYGQAEHSHPGSRKTSAQPLGDRQEMNMSGHRKGGVLVVSRVFSEAPPGLWKLADCSTVSLFHPLRVISFSVPMK